MNNISPSVVADLGNAQKRDDIPAFRAGDTVKVHARVVEGNRSRVQVFQGVVISRQGGGLRETFKVRKISFGVGVERSYPIHSPAIDRIEKAPIDKLIITNTIPLTAERAKCQKILQLPVGRLLGQAIRSIHEETSVSSLFV